MVKQKRRAIDQRPGNVLGGGQALVGQLPGAHRQVVPKLSEPRIDRHGLADFGQLVAQALELGIDRQRLLGLGQSRRYRFCRPGSVFVKKASRAFLLGFGTFLGLGAQDGRDLLGVAQADGRLGRGDRDPESADRVVGLAENLVQGERQDGPAVAAQRLLGLEGRPVGDAHLGSDGPAGVGRVVVAVDGRGDVELVLAEVGTGVLEGDLLRSGRAWPWAPILTSNSFRTKLPPLPRPGPFLGSESSARTSRRIAVIPFSSVSAVIV